MGGWSHFRIVCALTIHAAIMFFAGISALALGFTWLSELIAGAGFASMILALVVALYAVALAR